MTLVYLIWKSLWCASDFKSIYAYSTQVSIYATGLKHPKYTKGISHMKDGLILHWTWFMNIDIDYIGKYKLKATLFVKFLSRIKIPQYYSSRKFLRWQRNSKFGYWSRKRISSIITILNKPDTILIHGDISVIINTLTWYR